MDKLKELEFSVHVVKSLFENYMDYKESGDEVKASLMLKELSKVGDYISDLSKGLDEKVTK